MSILISVVLAVLFSVLSCVVTGNALMVLYLKKVNECLDSAQKKLEEIKERKV